MTLLVLDTVSTILEIEVQERRLEGMLMDMEEVVRCNAMVTRRAQRRIRHQFRP